jgi:hypothetical protein
MRWMKEGQMDDERRKFVRFFVSRQPVENANFFSSFPFHFSFILLSAFFLFSATPAHDYHVSVTQMQYNTAQKIFEISIKVFTDDLERGISQTNGSRRFAIRTNDHNDPYVESYVLKHFILSTPQKKAGIKYLGKEQEADATWIYLEIPFEGLVAGWRLQNSILMDIFDDQVNMFNIKYGSEAKTLLYKKGKSSHML